MTLRLTQELKWLGLILFQLFGESVQRSSKQIKYENKRSSMPTSFAAADCQIVFGSPHIVRQCFRSVSIPTVVV